MEGNLFSNFDFESEDDKKDKEVPDKFTKKKKNRQEEISETTNKKARKEKEIESGLVNESLPMKELTYDMENFKEKDKYLEKELSKQQIITENKITKIDKVDTEIKQILNNKSDSMMDPDMKLEIFEFAGCLHENITPKDYNKRIIKSDSKPAKDYEFTLDKFQERAILCLENGQSVLVSAHTSAGKTAVAQYAIAMALRDKQRVIYTSPIKALSNQKFRELQHEFTDVGLMTGDVTINSSASCLVMTTEILRNMLYKGTEVTRETAWVIFDEVHYMRDRERGVVWEETMILLSNNVKYVFLSATIPNAREFAMWICKIKNQPCNVVYTDFRPVPLQHYVYVSGGEGIYLTVDDKGNFKEENFNKAISILNEDLMLDKIFDKKLKNKKKGQENDIKKIITLIKEHNLDPAIIFSFSKRDCEANALSLSKMDLTNDDEKEMIEKIYRNAISTLSDDDQNLPQIQMMLPLLKNGIGVHHGGLLPIVKECVELIFQEGFIKALFSTETFSMGINMPAKTVVFTSIEKFDGDDFRWLTGGEYIQMSGRAGRRGLDDRGITIMMLNKKMDVDVCKNMLSGKSDPLYSTFHLSYSMITNLERVDGWNPEHLVKRSFHQYQSERAVPEIKNKISELYNEYKEITFEYEEEDIIKQNILNSEQIEKYTADISKIVVKPENIIPYLCPGRLVKIKGWGWGIVINFMKKEVELISRNKKEKNNLKKMFNNFIDESQNKNISGDNENNSTQQLYFIDTLLYVKNVIDTDSKLLPGDIDAKDGQLGVVPVVLNSFENFSSIKINLPHNLKDKKNLNDVERMFIELYKRFKTKGFPIPDPINDLEINDAKLIELTSKLTKLKEAQTEIENKIKSKKINETMIEKYKKKENIHANILTLLDNLKKMKELVLKDDLKNMKRVLRRLEFMNEETVLAKGQAACVISSGDEILLTEMLFNGFFNEIEPSLLCAVLSCFLSNEGGKNETKPIKNAFLQKLHGRITECAGTVADVLIECKININKIEYMENFRTDFMEVVLEWANGEKFSEICKLTEIYEGNIIRCIRRLDELIKQLAECCLVIGNSELKERLDKSSNLIKRGIIFAASLYLSA